MKQPTEGKGKNLSSKKQKSLKEKIKRHLLDKDDVITEEDLRDVVVGVDVTEREHPGEPTFLAGDIPVSPTTTPWDILGKKK